jgi:hypothetical protein
MKKELLNELNQMKFMFGYRPGKVLSEQNTLNEVEEADIDFDVEDEIDIDDDIFMSEPDVAEPETKPKTRPRPETPDTDPFPNPFDPERGKEFNPLPDAEPQGRRRRNIHDIPGMRPVSKNEVNEPYIEDAEPTYELELDMPERGDRSSDLESLVKKYLSKKDEPIYEIHLNGNIDELF